MPEDFLAFIEANLGHAPQALEPGRIKRFATSAKQNDDAGWAIVFDDERTGVCGDHRTGVKYTWHAGNHAEDTRSRMERAAWVRQRMEEVRAQEQRQWAKNAEYVAQIWNEAEPIEKGDSVDLYLQSRGIDLPRFPGVLRRHPELEYWSDGAVLGDFPAMVAAVRDLDGQLICLHRTYLTHKGAKAPVPKPKKLTRRAGPMRGAAIWLNGRGRARETEVIGVAEGIETALACYIRNRIVIAASMSAGMLKQFQWPAQIKELVIFADNDKNQVGQDAGLALAARASAAGIVTRLLVPEQVGSDWADVHVAAQLGDAE
jgi:putative DNA primase/helicase